MNKTIKNLLKYLIEMIIVAFGVFLGVYFGNVNAENKTKKEKEKSIRMIVKELEVNKQLLQQHITYHQGIKKEIDSIIPSLSEEELYSDFTRSKFKYMEIKGWTGFRFARLQQTAYESTKTSGVIKEFDIELIQKLSDCYYFQDTYVDFGASILNKAVGMHSSMKTMDFIGTIELMTSDLLGLEKELMIKLENTISELGTAH